MHKIHTSQRLIALLALSPFVLLANDYYNNGGVHIVMPYTNEIVEIEDDRPICTGNECWEQAPWTRHTMFEDPEEDRDIPGRLENDTAWPGQREDFSDYLFR